MSEYAHDEGSPPRHGNDSNLHNISLEDPANNSIIGKVKSRVSSILPNRLSKWFSPSAKLQNDSLNGSICGANTTLPTRRRRRLEIEEEENYDDDEEDVQENNHRNANDENDDDDDDGSQNSDDEYNAVGGSITKQTRRDLNVESRQPPAKRSRLNTEIRDSPLITRHQPLLSSTPAVGSTYSRNSSSSTSVSRTTYQRLNLYSNQNKKEPAFNFGQHKDTKSSTNINTDIIDLISNPSYENEDKLRESSNAYSGIRTGISSRKSLNIPSSTSTLTGVERVYATVAHLKRQPLSAAKSELSSTHTQSGAPPRRTSTTIQEVQDREAADDELEQQYVDIEKGEDLVADNANTYNGRVEGSNNFGKRQKLINGTGLNTASIPESNEAILLDSASESGESAMDLNKPQSNTQQRKTGLFNMSTSGVGNTRNSSRTSSFGNGLNFYSHLEGRKSLFSGSSNHGISNTLNNSTLSLTSLNRRQFNASIYGSTSALSDSRLLNTFSPFYKGKTTYGGAAAYNKYTAGAGASTVRITPTLIRPTSSLSTLSSNTSSLTNNVNAQVGENSTISSTAKRILDLINDFATPLSEAKKMASSLKTNPNIQIPPQAKGRLNESDLNASRAMRLSQVRTPYSRPSVILQPSGNASGRGISGGPLPPVKELQVPTMSQLLQMKKMQNTTEKARKIAQNSATNTGVTSAEYTLPDVASTKTNTNSGQDQEQQKHTNKIRNKVTNSLRPSAASKDLQDEEPPPPVNLPNIAFPLMQSVPKIDIQLNKPSAPNTSTNTSDLKTLKTTSAIATNVFKTDSSKSNTTFAFNPAPLKPLNPTAPSSTTDCKKMQPPTSQSNIMIANFTSCSKTTSNTFKFSEPIQVAGVTSIPTQSVTKNDIEKYKFSPPLDVVVPPTSNAGKIQNSQTKQPQLKEGSCLAALAKPFNLPTTTTLKTSTTDQKSSDNAPLSSAIGFGNQFKKSTNEWECDACMIRNKSDVNKCVACETPRKQSASTNQQPLNSSSFSATTSTSTFGQQFKKSSNEWECDACMIRNKQEATKCIACETPRKGASQQSASTLPSIKNSFGDAFKPKAGTWECQTCMISNKNDVNECVACQTKKPGSTSTSSSTSLSSAAPASQFKFGFAAAAPLTNANSNADAGFKSLAAQQKASKWECDACMTRNDSNRTKCACCEQPKPGSTSAEATDSSTKFQFGATAASKFTFGFGTGANVPKEDDLRKEMATKKEETSKPAATAFVAPTQGGFQFGIKPISTTSSTSENRKDETDANKKITSFKFGAAPAADSPKASEKSTVSSASTSFGFSIISNPTNSMTSPTPSLSSATTASTPSVKFTLPTTTTSTNSAGNTEKPATVAAPTFGFGTSSSSSTPGGFSFGTKTETKPTTAVTEEKKGLESFAFKAPASISTTTTKNTGLVFGSSTTNSSSTTSTTLIKTSNSMATTASTSATTTTAAVKPMFSFGSSASNTPAPTNSQATPAFGGFSFGSNNSAGNATATTTASSLFGANISTSTTTANATSTVATNSTPASTNIFGTFSSGGASSNASVTPIFGSSAVNPPANNNSTTVSSSTNKTSAANTPPTFGSFGGSKTTSNVFGSFGGVTSAAGLGGTNNSPLAKSTNETKPTLPVFGTVATSSTSSQSNSSGFVFGSSATTNNSNQLTTTASATSSVTSTSTTWPKNSFVFGSAAAPTSSTNIAPSTSSTSENKDVAKPSVFGSFGSTSTNSTNQQQTSSIFGVPSPSSASGPSNSSSNLFGTNSVPAATSIFGANSSGTAATPAPAFGSSPFGGAASSTSATPTFGSTAASGTTTFGGFGATSNNTTTNTTEVKKPEAAFNFGAAPATQSTSGGFNFGSSSSATKPAFNFGGTSTPQQPTFNFTGTAESQSSTKPFQFGATPSAPVFNFSRGALEGTPNAPFQFNAGAAPVSSNIFAPTPTPGAQTAQQAKRKIRAPIRRVTQR